MAQSVNFIWHRIYVIDTKCYLMLVFLGQSVKVLFDACISGAISNVI